MPDEPCQSDDNLQRIHQSIFDRVKALFIRTGNISQTVVQGIPAEQFQRLAEELGVTKAALTSFFKILEQQRVPTEDLDAKLREIATHYNTLLARVHTLSANDPHIAHLRDTAEIAIREGEFDRAERLLNEASARDLAAAQELQDILAQRLLAAAEAKATNGELKATQLAYAAAVDYYRQAVELVEHLPAGSEEHLAGSQCMGIRILSCR